MAELGLKPKLHVFGLFVHMASNSVAFQENQGKFYQALNPPWRKWFAQWAVFKMQTAWV